MKKYYMVRAMLSSEEDLKLFQENSIVAVGWSKVDFSKYINQPEMLREKVVEQYYKSGDFAPQSVGRQLNQVVRFVSIKTGDYIVVPYWSQILLAEATENFRYDKASFERDLSNQLVVNYKKHEGKFLTIPRNALSEGLQRRLRVRGNSVGALDEFHSEIAALFEKGQTFDNTIYEAIQHKEEKFKRDLEHVLTDGKNNLQTGGIGLERLVCELMQCEGYDAKVLDKKRFEGMADADIEAFKEDRFNSQKIFIQVKHHSDVSDSWGIEQLEKIIQSNKYSDHTYVFVTSAKMTEEDKKRAEDDEIIWMDGSGLAEWIVDNIDKLSSETLNKLRISPVPSIVDL